MYAHNTYPNKPPKKVRDDLYFFSACSTNSLAFFSCGVGGIDGALAAPPPPPPLLLLLDGVGTGSEAWEEGVLSGFSEAGGEVESGSVSSSGGTLASSPSAMAVHK